MYLSQERLVCASVGQGFRRADGCPAAAFDPVIQYKVFLLFINWLGLALTHRSFSRVSDPA